MDNKNKLYSNFDNVRTRPGRGGNYPYITWQDVADRMNEVFGITWSSEVISQDVVGDNVVVRVRVTVLDPETKTDFVQEGFGGAPNDSRQEAGNPFKAAYSKALKDACKKWGVGLHLEEGANVERTTPEGPSMPPGYTGYETGVPPTQADFSAPTTHPEPVQHTPTVPTTPPVSPDINKPLEMPASVQMAGNPLNAAVPNPGDTMSADIGIVQVPETVEMPSIPTTPPAQPAVSAPAQQMVVPQAGNPAFISDVQKAALHSILSIKGVEYETLAREAFEFNGVVKNPIPSADDLTYQEAVYVVKYGNDKFRKR